MKVVVDLNRCQAYAQCIYAAPDHFALYGAEALVYDTAPDEAARADPPPYRPGASLRGPRHLLLAIDAVAPGVSAELAA